MQYNAEWSTLVQNVTSWKHWQFFTGDISLGTQSDSVTQCLNIVGCQSVVTEGVPFSFTDSVPHGIEHYSLKHAIVLSCCSAPSQLHQLILARHSLIGHLWLDLSPGRDYPGLVRLIVTLGLSVSVSDHIHSVAISVILGQYQNTHVIDLKENIWYHFLASVHSINSVLSEYSHANTRINRHIWTDVQTNTQEDLEGFFWNASHSVCSFLGCNWEA